MTTNYLEKIGNEKGEDVDIDEYLDYIEGKDIPTKQEDGKNYAEVNGKIYEITIEDGDIKIEYVGEGEITDPRIRNIEVVNKTINSIQIKVDAVRLDNGTYTYYIGTSTDNLEEKGSNKTGEYTFTGLSGGKYYIRVVGEREDGKTAEKTIEVELESIPDATTGNIQYEITWKNGLATVTLRTTSKYTIQYSKDNTTYRNGTIVTDLRHGDNIYARLTDGNYAGKEMRIPIRDEIKPTIEITVEEATTRHIEIEAKATDNESGISKTNPYKFYISNAQGEIGGVAGTNTTGEFLFNDLDQNTEYTIRVEVEDVAGNSQKKDIKVKTETIPGAETGIQRTTNWNSDGTVQIELSTFTGFDIVYSTDRNNWTSYPAEGITTTNGTGIYMCLTDGRNRGEDYRLEVTDREGPQVTVERGLVSSNSITVNVQATDRISGMPANAQYNYYIKTSEEGEYKLIAENQTSTTYTFRELTAQTTYNIRVTTRDIVGNEGEGTLDVTTNEFSYITGNISISNAVWSEKLASVTLTNNTEYIMEYKVIEAGEEIDLGGTWERAENRDQTVGNLKNGDTVIGRLTDGTNTSGYATTTIMDTINPSIEITGNPSNWTNQNVTITVNAQDHESGLQAQAYSFDGGLTWQAQNTKTYDRNTTGINIQVRDEAGNIASQTLTIDKIDKEGPLVNIETETSTNAIKINIISTTDTGVGVEDSPEYRYYITTNSSELETMAPSRTSGNKTEEFTSLTQNTTYYIKVEVEDKLGNVSKTYRTVSTGSLDASSDDFKITDPTWNNKQAEVEITNSSNYDMEYQVVKSGGTFNPDSNWILVEKGSTGESKTQLTGLLHGDTVYARLTDGNNVSGTIIKEIKDETNPSLEVTGNPTDWTNQNVTITVNATDNESGLQAQAYSFDGGVNWQAQNTKTYEQNTAGINIQVRDEAGNIASETLTIDKIDKEGPSIAIEEQETTTKSITINIRTSTDSGVGIEDTPTYTYYIKEGEVQEDNPDLGFTKKKETTETTYPYENLKANTTYTVKVEVSDRLGNVGKGTIEITTRNLIYQEDIKFINPVWSNSIVTVTAVNSREEFDMEYQIGKAGAGINLNGTWTQVSEKEIDIGNLEDGDVIYARLTDGVNVTSGYAIFIVENQAKETYTEQELAEQTTREDYDILGISTGTNELRLQIEEAQENAKTYNYYYKTINDDEYKLISTSTNYNDPAVIREVEEGTIYKIKALVIDTEGNVTRSENTATMIALGEAEEDKTYQDNRTYIDNSKEIEVMKTAGTGTIRNGETEKVEAGYTVSLPEGFKISGTEGETKEEDGVVLKDANNNEYVWIPVNDAIYDETTDMPTSSGTAGRTYKPMSIKQAGYDNYYESIIYTFNSINSWRNSSNTGIGKNSYREPSLITNNQNDGYTWNIQNPTGITYDADEENYKNILGFETIAEFGNYLASSYNNMITAVDSYGGFYVGRYETTTDTNTSTGTENAIIVGSKPNSKPLSETNWYRMYLYQDNQRYEQNPYHETESIASTMIYGSQWDAMLNYILRGNDKNKVTTQIGSQKNVQSNTAQDANDIINNIYDLSSNVYEWTQEANNINYRVYRGGSYDSSVVANASTRRQVNSTDQGPVFGTRLALYVKSTNDQTGPSTSINRTESTSNTITVEVTATDKETGVDRYRYYISEDGESWGTAVENTSTTYTFTGLLQNTTYYIKVEAVDGAGNIGEAEQTEINTKSLGNVAKTGITRTQKYGANGQGIINLSLAEEYTNSGYYIEYQVLEQNETIDTSTGWTKGEIINNLSNGQKLYASIYDGKNRSNDYYEETVEGLEEYAYIDLNGNTYTEQEAQNTQTPTTYNATIEYEDKEGNTATIPAGFQVGTSSTVNTIQNGLVIRDSLGNEFVWVPVETAIETDTSTTSTEKAMARYQSGYNQDSRKKYYEGILYDFTGTTSKKKRNSTALGISTNREPSLITGGADYTWNLQLGNVAGTTYDLADTYYKYMGFGTTSGVEVFNSYTEFGQYMNEEYTNMVQSVNKFGGFYIGRYETSVNGTAGNKDAVAQSQINKTPLYNQNWYKDYYYQNSNINSKNPYYNSTSVTSSMVWGSQWDAMMNWMLEDENTKDFVTKITGNHEDAVAQTGSYTDDLAKNIFDLSSNMAEWTQEGSGTTYREIRGGYAVLTSDRYGTLNASSRLTTWRPPTMTTVYTNPTNSGGDSQKNYLGSRITLYINNTEDTTPPEVEVASIKEGTNNIEVTVNAIDDESGINKYKYFISYKNFENDSSFNEQTDILNTAETHGNTYAISGLLQGQTYYVKVEVTNGSGLTGIVYTGAVQTEQIDLQEGDITLEKVWGKEGEGKGKAYFILKDEYENEGYELEHQIVKKGGTFQEGDEYWTQDGDTVTGLTAGDTIYTRITDGRNEIDVSSYKITNISELETYSEVYNQTTVYNDYDTNVKEDGTEEQVLVGTAYIPSGFRVGTSSLNSKIQNGLVIEDEAGNQYVWIPVKDVIYDGETALSATYKPMVRYQQGYNENTEQYFEGIYYTFSGTNSTGSTGYRLGQSSYREPSLVTNSEANYSWIFTAGNDYDATNYNQLNAIGITSAENMGQYLNNKYTEMVESIEKYGGYYVGRYETSSWVEDNWAEGGTNSDRTGEIVKSVPNATPMASTNWYQMYLKQNSEYSENPYSISSSVTSTMMSGSQWDTMLNFILTGSDKEKVKERTGNHTGTRSTTGQFGSDIMNNIFDLSSNVREWTSEALSSRYRASRGGFYGVADTGVSGYRIYDYPTYTFYVVGSRLSLYIK